MALALVSVAVVAVVAFVAAYLHNRNLGDNGALKPLTDRDIFRLDGRR